MKNKTPKEKKLPRIENRRARHDYEIFDEYEAGIELKGCEIKSIRGHKGSLAGAYCKVNDENEMILIGMDIPPFESGSDNNEERGRNRRLLLHKDEIRKIKSVLDAKGFTCVPLNLHFRKNKAKIDIAVAKGKALYDKRDTIRKRETDRISQRTKLK